MAPQTLSSAATSLPTKFPHFRVVSKVPMDSAEPTNQAGRVQHEFSWVRLSAAVPLIRILQPDFYMIFRYTNPGVPVYQQNIHLDFGPTEVKYDAIKDGMEKADWLYLQKLDSVIHKFAGEFRIQPFDFISTVFIRWNAADTGQKYFMRKTTVLECDDRGVPRYGMITFKDVTPLVSAIKPFNVDIVFQPDKSCLCGEIINRIKAVQPKGPGITCREKEIVRCLRQGMSSKEIATALFISKATVDTHRQNLIHKLGVTNTAALLQRAMEEGCL